MTNRKVAVTLATAALCALPAANASAHVTLQPKTAPAGEFVRLDVRVPNERDNKGTTKVDVQFPDGFIFVSYEPVPGWKTRLIKERLDKPIESHGESIDEQVDRVVFTAREGEEIRPGEFRDFGLSVGLPDKRQTLTFKALQTYQGGEVVRWIGEPDSDEPAAQVKLTAADGDGTAQTRAAAPAAESESEDDDGNGLGIAALVVAALALATAVFGLVRPRRRTA